MILQGKDIILYAKGDGVIGDADTLYPMACARNCILNITSDMLEVTNPDSGIFKSFLPTYVGYTVSGSGLSDFSKVMGVRSLKERILNRNIIVFKFVATNEEGETSIYSGQGYVRNIRVDGPVQGASTFSYEIIGTDTINTESTIPIDDGSGTPSDEMAQVLRKQFIAVQGQHTYQDADLIGATMLFFTAAGQPLYKGDGNYQMTGLNSVTGILTWNYPLAAGSECILLYKK